MLEDRREESDLHASCEDISTDTPIRHCYVDVQNREESDYDLRDQHIKIDPTFRAHIYE